ILKYSCPAAESTNNSATDIEYSSFGVALFKSLKSIQTLRDPFFLITGTMLANHSTYLAVRMNLHLSNLSISALIFVMISGANLLGSCFTGFLSGRRGN